jgi:pentatricopeptide repeat protein
VKIYSRSREVNKALKLLTEMKREGVKPGLVVYTCLIQTCVRNNLCEEAEQLFREMQIGGIKPDAVTFATLIKGQLHC